MMHQNGLGRGQNEEGVRRHAWWVSGVIGVGALAWAATTLGWMGWGGAGIMTALAIATGWFGFPVQGRSDVSFSTAVFVASLALFGTEVGIWVAGPTALVLGMLKRGSGVRGSVQAMGVKAAAAAAAGSCYSLMGGGTLSAGMGVVDVGRILVLFGVFAGVTAAFGVLTDGRRPSDIALEIEDRISVKRGVSIEAATVPLALLLVMSYTVRDVPTFPLLAITLVLVSATGKTLWDTRRSLLKRLEELRALNHVGQTLSSTLRFDELLDRTFLEVRRFIPSTAFIVGLHDEETGELRVVARCESHPNGSAPVTELDSELMRRVIRTREALVINDLEAQVGDLHIQPRLLQAAAEQGRTTRSWVGVPLLVADRLVGAVAFAGETPSRAADKSFDAVETLAGQIAGALENARLYGTVEASRADVESWNHELERRVEERTAELWQARADLQSLNDELERRVEGRTKELREMQEKLVRSGKLAAVGELAAGIAHELNNPIGGILGYVQFDREHVRSHVETGLPPESVEKLAKHLEHIERESQRCKRIVEKLLHFSRSSRTSYSPIDINAVLDETVALTKQQLDSHGIELQVALNESLPAVVGDRQQLQQVFANIILNARNAMGTGGKLSVSTLQSSTGERDDVAVTFRDTGSGISEENIPRVFEPFFTTREVGEGTGLGLSVSYGIIKDHGGDIDVESDVGEGTTFTIRLPAYQGGVH